MPRKGKRDNEDENPVPDQRANVTPYDRFFKELEDAVKAEGGVVIPPLLCS